MKKTRLLVAIIAAVALLASCATSTGVDKGGYSKNQNLLREGRTAEAALAVEKQKKEYNDEVLYYLDLGTVRLYSGDYEGAVAALEVAEDAIDEFGVASVTENLTALLSNDYAIAYPGEKYEEVFADVFSAIAYQQMGDSEAAMVEVRQAETKLNDFRHNADQQRSSFESLVLKITRDPFKNFKVPEVEDFTGSAFADYMSMLMYLDMGDVSNAEVDYRRITNRASSAGAVSEDDIHVPAGMARVSLISLEGLIGFKESHEALVTTLGIPHQVSWPWFKARNSAVQSVTLTCSNGQSVTARSLEDFNNLAMETMAMDVESDYLKSFYRGYTKGLAAKATYDTALEQARKVESQMFRRAAELAAQKAFEVAIQELNETEIADTRMGQYFPARASVAGLTVEPGVYDFTVTYRFSSGDTVTVTYNGVEVTAGKANIIFSTCAR